MIETVQTRLILLKKQPFSHLFWALFPLLATAFVMIQVANVEEDYRIPVGIVVEDDSMLVHELLADIEDTPHIEPVYVQERDGLRQVEMHELDSLFVVRNQYTDDMERGKRNKLITSYYTELSFAYVPVREMILSYVQQDFTRNETANRIEQLRNEYRIQEKWDKTELIERSREIEREQHLIDVTLSFGSKQSVQQEVTPFISPLLMWALFAFFGTAMMFDWLIKEKHPAIMKRLPFSNVLPERYFFSNVLLYTVVLLFFDFVAVLLGAIVLDEKITFSLLLNVFSFRLTINSLLYVIGRVIKTTYVYYIVTFIMTLCFLLLSGIIIPIEPVIERFPFVTYVHPLLTLQTEQYVNVLFIISIISLFLLYRRKKVEFNA